MSETTILYLIACVAAIIGPGMTRRFLLSGMRSYTRTYTAGYAIAIAVQLIGIAVGFEQISIVWLILGLLGVGLAAREFLRERRPVLEIGVLIPLVFSVISALWFFGATNDLRLLGYNEAWSLYASIHGAFLGWIVNGCLIRLYFGSNDNRYLIAVYSNFILFLIVAFGIDGAVWLKKIGVIGLSVSVPVTIAYFVHKEKRGSRSRMLGWASLISIALTMSIAGMNEFWPGFPRHTLGLPTMVWSHGLLNAVITIPSFFFAVHLSDLD